MQPFELPGGKDKSPDSDDRVRDFWSRHGGPGERPEDSGEIVPGLCGWSQVYAADGYSLRCEWSHLGGRREMTFTEKPPPSGAAKN